jgi:hypothetical protein
LNERRSTLCNLALGEVKGMLAIESTKQASASPRKGRGGVFLTLLESEKFTAEVTYDDRRIHGGYFDLNMQFCADFQGSIWFHGADGFEEAVWVVL